ncbi:MAG: type II secretion system F family protein [Candidatus Hydrogenedentes bacterium]|nr:type II secretion system F family protein [Candidatus Hydrogenedentota bacterium]
MPLYRYKAVDANGQASNGTMDEASARRVTAILEEQGLQVSSVEPAEPAREFLFRGGRVSWEDVEFLNTQLIALTRSGLPLAPALEAIGKELRRGALKNVVDDLHSALQSGKSLSDSLERHRGAVPPVYIAAIRAGEETGNLPAILQLCAGYTAQMVALRSRLREAMTYPVVALVMMAMMMTYLLTYTIPQFADVFRDFGAKLPALTMFWLNTSEFIRLNFGAVLASVCVVIVAVSFAARTEQGRYVGDWLRLKVWGIGHAFNSVSMARFCRSMGILLSSKAPMDTSIALASATCGNTVLEAAARDAADSVRNGMRLSQAFESTGYFSGLFCWLLQVSEERGDMDQAFLDLAKSYDETFSRVSGVMLSVLTPAILCAMALIVVSVILSLYLPIFTLANVMSGQ